jgi:chromosome segregation ATPase
MDHHLATPLVRQQKINEAQLQFKNEVGQLEQQIRAQLSELTNSADWLRTQLAQVNNSADRLRTLLSEITSSINNLDQGSSNDQANRLDQGVDNNQANRLD